MQAPRGTNFSFTIQLGIDRQLDMVEGDVAANVFSELVKLLGLFNEGQVDALHERFPDEDH